MTSRTSIGRALLLPTLFGGALWTLGSQAFAAQGGSESGLWENTVLGQEAATCLGYVGQPGFAVRDRNELRRMCERLESQYNGMEITHSFEHNGSTVHCVTFESQPAVRRLLALGETVLKTPPPPPQEAPGQGSDGDGRFAEDRGIDGSALALGKRDVSGKEQFCDGGSVPYVFTRLGDLARFPAVEDAYKAPREAVPRMAATSVAASAVPTASNVREYAAAYPSTISNYGVGAYLNYWKTYVETSSDFTLSQVWVTDSTMTQTLEAGWSIFPSYNQSGYDPELFVAYTPDGYKTWCNKDCADFVQVSGASYYPGMKLTPVSTAGGQQYRVKLLVQKYPYNADGNWWVAVEGQYIGYFPKSVYGSGGMASKSTELTFGGEIKDAQTGTYHTKTDMGSGEYPGEGFGYAAYQRTLKVIKTDGLVYNVTGLKTDGGTLTDSSCYDIDITESSSGDWGTYFYFGGEGYYWPWCVYPN